MKRTSTLLVGLVALFVVGCTPPAGRAHAKFGGAGAAPAPDSVQYDASTGTVADFVLNASTNTVVWTGGSALTVQGMTGGVAGRRVCWINTNAANANVQFSNETGATVANRTHLKNASGLTLAPNAASNSSASACFEYVAGTINRWKEESELSGQSSSINVSSGRVILSVNSRLADSGTGPALTSCGTSPTVTVGEGKFTITTGATATGCIATFASAFTNAPTCTVSSQSGTQPAYTTSTTAVTLGAGTAASTNYDVDCTDH